MKTRNVLILISIFLCSFSSALADMGWNNSLVNGPLSLSEEHPFISMVAEDVQIHLHNDYVEVNATFTMVNSGPETTVPVYFPIWEYSNPFASFEFYESTKLENWILSKYGGITGPFLEESEFNTGTNGKRKLLLYGQLDPQFTVTVDQNKSTIKWIERTEYRDHKIINITAAKWAIKFAEDETKTITCHYITLYDTETNHKWPEYFKYILYTGATWAGPIGYGRIVVQRDLPEFNLPLIFVSPETILEWRYDEEKNINVAFPEHHDRLVCPAEITVSNDVEEITWEFSDYEPDEEACIYIMPLRNEEGWYYRKSTQGSGDYKGYPGIIIAQELEMFSSPKSDSDSLGQILNKGEQVTILQGYGEWWRVQTADGVEGWIRWRSSNSEKMEEIINATFTDW